MKEEPVLEMKKMIRDLPWVLIGNFMLALAVAMFILPYNILSGGVAGIAVALEPLFHIDPTMMVNALVLGMFVLGTVFLGKSFAVKTVISSLIYPVYLTVITRFVPILELDPMLASLYGGLIGGLGIGMVLRTGASTGGMDIPPLIVNKYTGIKISTLVLITDALTVGLGLFTYGLEAVLVGFISVWGTSFGIDKMLTLGGGNAKAVQIISEAYVQINAAIQSELDRGTTLTDATGGYTGAPRKVILVVVEKKEYPKLLELVNRFDKNAFMITSDATDVHGEGFSLEFKV